MTSVRERLPDWRAGCSATGHRTHPSGRAKYESAMRGHLGAVAATVIDGETAPRCAKNGSPVRNQARGTTESALANRAHARPVFGHDLPAQDKCFGGAVWWSPCLRAHKGCYAGAAQTADHPYHRATG